MIIKRWDTTSSTWQEEYPKTTISNLYLDNGTDQFLDGGKIRTSLLPNSVFDNLTYLTSISSNTTLAALADAALTAATSGSRSLTGYYWVASAQVTLSGSQPTATQIGSNYWNTAVFPDEEGAASDISVTLEAGDWIILDRYTGTGTSGDPYDVLFAVVNNTYEDATATVKGIVKLGDNTTQSVAANSVSATSSRTYAIQKNSDSQLVVNVPWTAYSEATSSVLGLVKIGYTENAKNYPVELDEGQMYVNVPWTDTNTTYTGSTGVTLVGTDFQHADTSSVGNVDNSNGTVIQDLTFDAFGHVTATGSVNLDGRYYTESEIDTELGKRKELYVQASAPSTTTADAIWFDI